MNGIAASMLLHLTSSMRFEGPMNVDLNEITMNLVPFPRLHFLQSSMAPLYALKDVGKLAGRPRAMDQVGCARTYGPAWCMLDGSGRGQSSSLSSLALV